MTKEYKTVSSMLLMLRWRTLNENFSSTAIILRIWPGIRREMILRRTLDPEILASTSATDELQHAATSPALSNPKGLWWSSLVLGSWSSGLGVLGPGLGLKLVLCFFDSKACKTCCNSLMNSITPPMIDAWSPLKKGHLENLQVKN